MSRIFPPAAYGQFAVFNTLVSNLSMLTTLTYQGAFLLPKSKRAFFSLVQLTVLLTVSCSALLFGAMLLGGRYLIKLLNLEGMGNLFYTIPVLLLFFNLRSILLSWYTREKQFLKRSSVEVTTSFLGRGGSIAYGWMVGGSVEGLLIGEFLNRVTTTVALAAGSVRNSYGILWRTFSWQRVRAVATEYSDFPLYQLPASFISTLSAQLPIYALSASFGTTAVGLYSFSVNLLEIPINLIGNALQPVFWQKAVETYNTEPERLPGITLALFYKLLYLGLLPFGIITIYGDILFKIIFGARWEMAGVYTAYLGYYYIFKLLSIATSPIYVVLGKQRYILWSNIALLAVRGLGLGIGLWFKDLTLALLLYGLGSLLTTLAIDLQIMALLRLPVFRIALRIFGVVGATLILLKLIRMGFELVL